LNNDKQMTTAKLYEFEKTRITLRFFHRSNMYREKLASVRQTEFPQAIENDERFQINRFDVIQ